MLKSIIFLLIFSSVALLLYQLLPFFISLIFGFQKEKVDTSKRQLEEMFVAVRAKPLLLFYNLIPVIIGITGFIIFQKVVFGFLCGIIGLALPIIMIKYFQIRRKEQFRNQLPDAIMVISSSLKGGLSLIQAIGVIVEDMPTPISQEFSLILSENKMGVNLEDSLQKLNKKMGSEELGLMVNAILIAREVGGDLTRVLNRLSLVIRESKRLQENIKTLTLQGKIQAVIMSFLPVVFISWVVGNNPHHFDIMFKSELGKTLLIVAMLLQVTGLVLIQRFSKIK